MKTHHRLTLLAGAAMLLALPAFAADREDIQALNQSRISLTQAIETAAREGNGRAIDAEFDVENGRGEYEVKVLGQDTLVSYVIDADTGAVKKMENERIEQFFTRLTPQDLLNAQTTLTQAVGIAEQRAGGRALDIEAEREGEHIAYEVTVVRPDGSSQELRIDGMSGQVAER